MFSESKIYLTESYNITIVTLYFLLESLSVLLVRDKSSIEKGYIVQPRYIALS